MTPKQFVFLRSKVIDLMYAMEFLVEGNIEKCKEMLEETHNDFGSVYNGTSNLIEYHTYREKQGLPDLCEQINDA